MQEPLQKKQILSKSSSSPRLFSRFFFTTAIVVGARFLSNNFPIVFAQTNINLPPAPDDLPPPNPASDPGVDPNTQGSVIIDATPPLNRLFQESTSLPSTDNNLKLTPAEDKKELVFKTRALSNDPHDLPNRWFDTGVERLKKEYGPIPEVIEYYNCIVDLELLWRDLKANNQPSLTLVDKFITQYEYCSNLLFSEKLFYKIISKEHQKLQYGILAKIALHIFTSPSRYPITIELRDKLMHRINIPQELHTYARMANYARQKLFQQIQYNSPNYLNTANLDIDIAIDIAKGLAQFCKHYSCKELSSPSIMIQAELQISAAFLGAIERQCLIKLLQESGFDLTKVNKDDLDTLKRIDPELTQRSKEVALTDHNDWLEVIRLTEDSGWIKTFHEKRFGEEESISQENITVSTSGIFKQRRSQANASLEDNNATVQLDQEAPNTPKI
ncbi:MAG: hypothetical protein K0Q74_1256 [Gammaproteobacteria bacterium]|nr:hypothetical protein [Gammaproteobacteria bacterium]